MSTTSIVAGGRSYRVAYDIATVRQMIADAPSVNRHKMATFNLADPEDSAVVDPYGVSQIPEPGTLVIDCATIEALS